MMKEKESNKRFDTIDTQRKAREILIKSALIIVIIVMFAVFGIMNPRFLSVSNMMNIMRQIAFNGILVVGMVIVIIAGGTNLSVGSTAALTCVLSFMMVNKGIPVGIAVICSIGVGALCGAVCGLFVAYGKVPAFILTLGVGISIRGVAMLLCGGRQLSGEYPKSFSNIASGYTFGMPNLFLILMVVVILGIVMMNFTVLGKWIYGVGGNAEAAKLAGINVERIKLLTFIISSALAGLVGMLMASRTCLGDPTVANGFDLTAVATAVIGGTSMSGGVGGVFGGFLGAIIMGTMSNGFSFLGMPPLYQDVMEGIIVVAAVFWDTKSKGMKR